MPGPDGGRERSTPTDDPDGESRDETDAREGVPARGDTGHEDATDGSISVVGGGTDRREVVVDLRLYKTVTVFSTLLAVVFVVVGFAFLDAATLSGSVLWRVVALLPVTVTLPVSDGALSGLLALLGVAWIAFGAWVYVLGARFRTAEMGKGKDDSGGPSDDG